MDLVIPDHIADSRRHGHDLEGRDHPPVQGGYKLLRDDCIQYGSQLDRNLSLLVCGEDVDDTVDGVGRPDRVQGGQKQVTGLGGGHGHVDRVVIPHFSQ